MKMTFFRLASVLVVVGFCAMPGSAATMATQSPVNIVTGDAVYDPNLESLDFNYTHALTTQLFHNTLPDPLEQTIQARPTPGAANETSTIELGGKIYNFLQFHAHAAAEHLIDGVQGALEFHFVHRAADGALAVVGLIANIGQANAAFDSYFADLNQVPSVGNTFNLGATIDLAGLLPTDQRTYRYTGSLTTTPFTEGVSWNVFAQQIEISKEQLQAFLDVIGTEGDARDVQPLNGRSIVTDVAPVPVPLSVSMLLLALVALGVTARPRRNTSFA
jgi:carbonic anhydrase